MKKLLLVFILIFTYGISKEITLGVVPQQSPLKLAKKWLKITKYLQEETGLKVIFKTEKSIPEFEKVLYYGLYDIAYMNPYHFTVAYKRVGYEAFVRADKNIVGIVLSKDKNLIINKENLKGKVFLFPAPRAFAATMLQKHEFKQKFDFDVDKEATVRYVNSHDSVYKGIARGIGDIGGGIMRTYNNFSDINEKNKLHIVYKTKSYPSHPIAFNPRVSVEDVLKLQNAFLNMPNDLKKILSIKNFIKTNTEEYDEIQSIGVD